MTELRLAAIDGEATIAVGLDPIAASAHALGDAIEAGKIAVEKCILVAIVDGMVTYTAWGGVTLVEATGLLELASRRIERDMLDR